MTEKETKALVNSAEKEIVKEREEKAKKLIKEVITKTLDKIEEESEIIKEAQERKKIHKQNLDNIRAGRLDLIEERQKKSEKAREVSVIIVEKKEVHHHYPQYYWPYSVWINPYPLRQKNDWILPQVYCSNTDDVKYVEGGEMLIDAPIPGITTSGYAQVDDNFTGEITCNMAQASFNGTYELESGNIKYLG